jgi:cobalamin biosynthesis protein CobC
LQEARIDVTIRFATPALARLYDHGGDLASARAAFANAPEPWIDLSTGLNPAPYPLPPLAPDLWARLPEPAALAALQGAAARRYRASPERVVAAAGTQAILQALPHVLRARRLAIVGPTYAEHERCWRAAGADCAIVADLDEAGAADAVVVVNPNNPDGRLVARSRMLAAAERLAARGGWLIVDEAFMDFGGESIAGAAAARTIVLRSFGKAYGLAGVRLGFALAEPAMAAALRAALGPWPVSGPAIEIGVRALSDDAWLATARRRLEADLAWLDAALSSAGFTPVGGTALFRLVRHSEAAERFAALGEHGVLARPFRARPDWLRFGAPLEALRERVAAALRSAVR